LRFSGSNFGTHDLKVKGCPFIHRDLPPLSAT
jgi:hypothetical protein